MDKVRTYYSISIVPKVMEKKIREYPTIIPNNTTNLKLRFKETKSLAKHLNTVTKNLGDQSRLQSLVESFTGQAARWWGTHQNRLQSWMSASTYFVERFGSKKLTALVQITKFYPGDDPVKHVDLCQKEWKRQGYHDEQTWPHLFPSTLDDLPNKWYKLEEARGDTFTWQPLRENFIKDFSFILDNEKLKPAAKQLVHFIGEN